MQNPFPQTLQLPLSLASKIVLGPGRLVQEGFSLTRDFVIITEGVLAWLTALTLGGELTSSASEVAGDPFARAWDEVMRSPRPLRHPYGESAEATGDTQPAA